jgi:hypothetical protein
MNLQDLLPTTGGKPWNPRASKLLDKTLKERASEYESASPEKYYPWVEHVRQIAQATLQEFRTEVEGVVAHPKGTTVHVFVLTNNNTYNHELAMAIGRLEVVVDKSLRDSYEQVRLHPTPVWCMTENDKRSITQGGLKLL